MPLGLVADSTLPMAPPSSGMQNVTAAHQKYVHESMNSHDYLLLTCGIAVVLLVYLSVFLFHQWHKRAQQLEEERTSVLQESESYSVNLVRHLVPSVQVETYRFRGMDRKHSTVSLEFKELSLDLKSNGKRLLQGVTGSFQAGRMAAIMGPSGAGKTTFMNVLTGKAHYGVSSGVISANGAEADLGSLKSVMGFVPQDDVVHETLTVREQIFYSAKLRNKAGTSAKKITCIVEDVLTVMQLTHVQHSIVGGVEKKGISGGQRKRVNIGLELAMCPALLFLDEPTSGLDATSALGVIYSLKKMTELGMTIIMVIHQPRYSLFTLFDDVLLLGVGGRTAYLGPSQSVKSYFEGHGYRMPANENPADWIMDVLSGEVKNSEDPDLKPSALMEIWKKQDLASLRRQRSLDRRALTPDGGEASSGLEVEGRQWTNLDDMAVLRRALDDEWHKMDTNNDGMLQKAELAEVLASCGTGKPTQEVVDELFARMGGRKGFVTKIKFLDFLLGLLGTIAMDSETSRRALRNSKEDLSSGASSSSDDHDSLDEVGSRQGPVVLQTRDRMGFFEQYCTLLHRALVRWTRLNMQRAIGVGLMIFAGVTIGCIKEGTMTVSAPLMLANLDSSMTGLTILVAIYCLNIFGADRPVFWRESSSGINVLAFYLSRITVGCIDVLVLSILFGAVWYLTIEPADAAYVFMWPILLAGFNAAAMGVLISTLVPPRSSTLATCVVMMLLGAAVSDPKQILSTVGKPTNLVSKLSLFTWIVGMPYLHAVDLNGGPSSVPPIILPYEEAYRKTMGSAIGYWSNSFVVLTCMYIVMTICGYVGLRFMNRAKQA